MMIEVWSRLWPSTVIGRRSYRNILALVRDVAGRMDVACFPLIVTDGSRAKLAEHLELLRCYYYYNFVRPHGALRFGRETRTSAMQAGLATRRLTFREVFVCPPPSLFARSGAITCVVPSRLRTATVVDEPLAA